MVDRCVIMEDHVLLLFLQNANEHLMQKSNKVWGRSRREVAQTMHTHVSEAKTMKYIKERINNKVV
jgi:hypothetical protein